MAPATPIHALSALESQINVLANGRPRKPPVRLHDCALKELVQYKCNVEVSEKTGKPNIVCEQVVRLLRQCENGLSVETTAWEGWKARQEDGGKMG
ncbi:mitochondrial export protein Som1 [Boeremia exigua]|uniref:mitochondrial export protein Som1 n=1 Tax=Boeremia exigua TaxID=749465 RepID=UPI001E8DBD81|nr:mitochondrial export protein Som1 [Boeremia exigua]KAH6633677.1 mitochondrial export protein Som1 [Boeremia exigua]